MKLAWLTDTHLNFLSLDERKRFYSEIMQTSSDAVLMSGDIAEGPCITNILKEMSQQVQKPIYFVLGNHDYYEARVEPIREEMTFLTRTEELLYWLPVSGLHVLENDI